VVSLCSVALLPATADAHFYLHSPPAMYEQSGLGDPQKIPPCGDDGSAVATDMVTTYQAGDTITITIDETVEHPGHFRVAIADDPSQLPADPTVTPVGMDPCGSTDIQDPPVFPVLLDGALPHDDQLPNGSTMDVTIPGDFSCENCTLQIIQYMREHGAPCFYHHCATITVEGGIAPTTTDPTGASDSSSSDGESAESSSSGGNVSDTSGNNTTTSTTNDGSSSDPGTGAGPTTTPIEDPAESDGGCGCSHRSGSNGLLAVLFGLFGVGVLRSRRRRPAPRDTSLDT
jgi:MYXO-CTERM domain-containing protein